MGRRLVMDENGKLNIDDCLSMYVDDNVEENVVKDWDNIFVLIKASELSLDDDFMKFNPDKSKTLKFKTLLTEVIRSGVKDFWRPRIDPSFNESGTGICYVPGKKPATGQGYRWWYRAAKEFNRKCGSRLGTRAEYIAFLGWIIKTLVSNGWTKEKAWNSVCDDSVELGYYQDSKGVRISKFEVTGSREIYGFCDLSNTRKILADDGYVSISRLISDSYYDAMFEYHFDNYWITDARFDNYGRYAPLASITHYDARPNFEEFYCVGWIVCKKCPK